jgi:hypothetical protein
MAVAVVDTIPLGHFSWLVILVLALGIGFMYWLYLLATIIYLLTITSDLTSN